GRPSAGRLQRAVVAVDLLVRAAPLRDVLLDLVRGERVARLRGVQRLREDHAVDLALGRQQGAAGVALTHRRVEGVHVAADRAPVVDVRAVGRDPAADPGRTDVVRAVLGEAGDDRAVPAARVLVREPQHGRLEAGRGEAAEVALPVAEDGGRVVLPALAASLHGGFVAAPPDVRVGHDPALVEDETGALQDLAAPHRGAHHLDDGALRAGGHRAAR